MKQLMFLLAVVGCSHAYDRNFAGIDGLLSDTQRSDSAVAAAQELELQIKFDTGNGLRGDERFAPTRDRVLAALDTAARARPAEAAVILAKKSELLVVLGRADDAKRALEAAHDDKAGVVTCEYEARVAQAQDEDRHKAAHADACIANGLRIYAVCPSQPEDSVGDFRRCDASCAN